MAIRIAKGFWFLGTAASVLGWSEWQQLAHGSLVHAQGHLVVAWGALLVSALLMRRVGLGLWALLFFVAHLWHYSGPARAELPNPPEANQEFTLLWANCWGKPQVVEKVHELALQYEVDAVALCQAGGIPAIRRLQADYPEHRFDQADRIGLFSRWPIEEAGWVRVPEQEPQLQPSTRPWLRTQLALGSEAELEIWVGHVHTPWNQAHRRGMNLFRETVAHLDRELGSRPMIAIGDWNTTPWSKQYRALLAQGWVDARSGQWPVRTWREPKEPWLRWPIDHGFVRGGIGVTHAEVLPDIGSDHYPLLLRFAIPTQ